MKKIIYGILLCMMLVLTGCKKKSVESDGIKLATEYISSLNSYELSCEMTVYRPNKEVKMLVTVEYLKPKYYKVCFTNQNGNEQLIVKNDEGVFVLTPALNKEFKFDSEWPLNSSHGYLLEGICNDIISDELAKYTVDGDIVTIECNLCNKNNTASKLKFYFDSKEKKPLKACLLNDKEENLILVEFKQFTANKSLNKDLFNTKLIMEEKTNQSEKTEEDVDAPHTTLTITAGYVCDGATLSSSKVDDVSTILCYSGSNAYTIVAKLVDVYESNVLMDSYSSFEYLDCGLLLKNDHYARYFLGEVEVTIYSDFLSMDDIVSVASDISFS